MDDDSDTSSISPSLVSDSNMSGLEKDITTASTPFDGPPGDVILRTSDSVDFWVVKAILALASPVFATMFTLPQPSENPKEPAQTQTPIIDISEISSVLDLLLRMCYPIEAARLSELDISLIGDVLSAAIKYDIGAVAERLRRALIKRADRSNKDAIAAYAIACHLRLEEEARAVAFACLKWPCPGPRIPQLALMSGLDLINLLDYHRAAGETIVALFTKNRYHFVTTTCSAITPRNHPCPGSKQLSYTVNGEDFEATEYLWWASSKAVLSEALRVAPFATEKLSVWTLAPILESSECHTCKNKFFHGWDQTREAIISDMKKKVGKVQLVLSWK